MEKDVEMDNNIFRGANKNLSGEDIMMLSPLQLAYIGDAVYELLVRTYLLSNDLNVNDLHKCATKYVKAKGQAEIIHSLEGFLSDIEKTYVKKGRNAKTHSSPKNADLLDYKYATGLECIFGYLYLTGQDERIGEIFEKILTIKL